MLLENIKLSELPSVYLLDKDNLPNCPAIYFVADSKGQVLYIGRTVNLASRWREHHRFNQLKRFDRKNRISISWMTCSNDLNTLSNLENSLINLYKPPLNWSKVATPVRKITPAETALQQSLQQLAKTNTIIFGFDPIADEEQPTIYLVYPKLNCSEKIHLYSLHLSCISNKIFSRIAEYFLRIFCSFSKGFIFNDSL